MVFMAAMVARTPRPESPTGLNAALNSPPALRLVVDQQKVLGDQWAQ
jgi:hypothetical protein